MASTCWKNLYSLTSSLKFWKHGVGICSMYISYVTGSKMKMGQIILIILMAHYTPTFWGHVSTPSTLVLDYLLNSIFHFTWMLKYFHLHNKLVMDQLNHYIHFHRISYKNLLSQMIGIFFYKYKFICFQTKQLCDCIYSLAQYAHFLWWPP
jgi:hypothetical protein